MTLDPKEMADLHPSARMEVGRCWNAYATWRRLEYETRLAKNEFCSRAIALRAVHHLTQAKLANTLGLSLAMIKKWTSAYSDPSYASERRAKAKPRAERGRYARPDRYLAGVAPAPGSEPSFARIERNVRDLTEG